MLQSSVQKVKGKFILSYTCSEHKSLKNKFNTCNNNVLLPTPGSPPTNTREPTLEKCTKTWKIKSWINTRKESRTDTKKLFHCSMWEITVNEHCRSKCYTINMKNAALAIRAFLLICVEVFHQLFLVLQSSQISFCTFFSLVVHMLIWTTISVNYISKWASLIWLFINWGLNTCKLGSFVVKQK